MRSSVSPPGWRVLLLSTLYVSTLVLVHAVQEGEEELFLFPQEIHLSVTDRADEMRVVSTVFLLIVIIAPFFASPPILSLSHILFLIFRF